MPACREYAWRLQLVCCALEYMWDTIDVFLYVRMSYIYSFSLLSRKRIGPQSEVVRRQGKVRKSRAAKSRRMVSSLGTEVGICQVCSQLSNFSLRVVMRSRINNVSCHLDNLTSTYLLVKPVYPRYSKHPAIFIRASRWGYFEYDGLPTDAYDEYIPATDLSVK